MPKKSKYTPGEFELKIKKSKTGKGLFAMQDIPKDSCIIEYIGRPIPKEKQDNASGKYLFTTGRNLMIDGNIKENTARFINHACKANCEARGPRGKVYIFSLKKIKAGEELTYNYGDDYFNEYIKPIGCKCDSCIKK